jgi:hypothetical protein
MIQVLVLAAMTTGQVCQTATSYRQAYAAPTYAAPAKYAAAPYYPAKALVETTFIATELYQPVYGSLVGADVRAENRRNQDRATIDKLTAQIGGLNVALGRLEARLAAEVQPTEPTPQPPPIVPGKPTPQPVEPQQPPVPKVNPGPDDGSVPPPPVPGLPVPDATAQVLRNRCAACHSAEAAGTSGGKFALFAADDSVRTDIPSPKLLDLAFRVSTGNMPKKALPLPPDEQAAVKAWVLGDAKVAGFLGVAAKGPTQ